MEGIAYTILPLTFIAFSNIYQTKDKDEYKRYLNVNTHNHHYDGMTLDEWFIHQTA